jgi:hypothetical protein
MDTTRVDGPVHVSEIVVKTAAVATRPKYREHDRAGSTSAKIVQPASGA